MRDRRYSCSHGEDVIGVRSSDGAATIAEVGTVNSPQSVDRDSFLMAIERGLVDNPASLAVLRVDLDRFHRIREVFGPGVARIVMTRIVSRLQAFVGSPRRLLLYGPESFVCLAEVRSPESECLERLAQDVIAAVSEPVIMDDGTSIAVGSTVGVASGDDFRDGEPLRIVAAAELAVQRANALGSRRAHVYRVAAALDPTRFPRLFADMLEAVEQGQFIPYFQPVVRLPDLVVGGYEAVARWDHPVHGILMPADFIGEAEASGLIRGLDECVRDLAMRAASGWTDSSWVVSINVSAADLDSPKVTDHVRSCLEASALDPSRLILEVTETTMAQDWTTAKARLLELKALGLGLAVDDFGTGHMFLDRLTAGVFDVVKIDRSLVVHTTEDITQAQALLTGVTSLAHDLGMIVVAEGIETRAHLEAVIAAGCDRAQGYYFGEPRPGVLS